MNRETIGTDPSARDLMRAINIQAQRIVDLETVVFEMQRQASVHPAKAVYHEAAERIEKRLIERDTQADESTNRG